MLCIGILFSSAMAMTASHVELVNGDSSLNAEVFVKNATDTSINPKLYIAEYDNHGNIVDVAESADVPFGKGMENILSATLSKSGKDGSTYKAFIWSDNTPLASSSLYTLESPSLKAITADGKEIAFDAESKTATVCTDEKGYIPVIKGIATNNSFYVTTSYANDLTSATITVRNPATEIEVNYTVNIDLYEHEDVHCVVGGKSTDFVADSGVTNGYMSSKAVTTAHHTATNGILYTNLHGKDDDTVLDPTGSRWASNNPANSNQYHEIYYVDPSLEGLDYFAFNAGDNAYTGDTLLKFKVDKDCTIHILATNGNMSFAGYELSTMQSGNGWLKGRYMNGNFAKALRAIGVTPTYDLAAKYGALGKDAFYTTYLKTYYDAASESAQTTFDTAWASVGNYFGSVYRYSYSRTYELKEEETELEIVVPGNTNSSASSRDIIVVVEPKSPTGRIGLYSDYTDLCGGMTYAEYCKHAGLTAVDTNVATGTIPYAAGGSGAEKNTMRKANLLTTAIIYDRKFVDFTDTMGFENCYFIPSNVSLVDTGSSPDWARYAFSGYNGNGLATNAESVTSTKSYGTYDFSTAGNVPWFTFKVNKDCDVIITGRYLPAFTATEDGWTSGSWKSAPFTLMRDRKSSTTVEGVVSQGESFGIYSNYAVKSYKAGSIVTIYNDNRGTGTYGTYPYLTFLKFK